MTERKMLRYRPARQCRPKKATHLSKILAYAKNHMLFVSRKWLASQHGEDDGSYATYEVQVHPTPIYYLHTDGVYYQIDFTLLQRHPKLRCIYSQMSPDKCKSTPSKHFEHAVRWWIETQDLQIKDIEMTYMRDAKGRTFKCGVSARHHYTAISDYEQCRNYPVFSDRVYKSVITAYRSSAKEDDNDYYIALQFIMRESGCDVPGDLLNLIIQYL